MKTHSILISFVFILSVKLSIWGNGLLKAIPDLSSQAIDPLPPGDGSSNRDNGIRGDIAFKALITLSTAHKLELINMFLPRKAIYEDNSEAYNYAHPDGL